MKLVLCCQDQYLKFHDWGFTLTQNKNKATSFNLQPVSTRKMLFYTDDGNYLTIDNQHHHTNLFLTKGMRKGSADEILWTVNPHDKALEFYSPYSYGCFEIDSIKDRIFMYDYIHGFEEFSRTSFRKSQPQILRVVNAIDS